MLSATRCASFNLRLFLNQLLTTLSCQSGQSSSEADEEDSVEAVSFCPDATMSLVVTGTLQGRVSFWDLVHQAERLSYNQPKDAGIVKMLWHPKHSHLLFTAGLDGAIRLIDARSGTLVRQYTGHTDNILDMSISL